jgi:hypothetical protein
MLALCAPGKVLSAYVGNPNNGEIYGFRPGSRLVHRVGTDGQKYVLKVDTARPLKDQYLLLRDHPEMYSSFGQAIAKQSIAHIPQGLFKNIGIGNGSVGISFTQLWNSEVGGILLHSSHTTPWDLSPILGISQMLGFMFVDVEWLRKTGRIRRCEPVLTKTTYIPHETLIVHKSRAGELRAWTSEYRAQQAFEWKRRRKG